MQGGQTRLVTIDEIRKIGQPPEKMRKNSYVRTVRKVSPYFTKFFVEHQISANQVSSFSTLFGIVGGLLFSFGNYYLMLIGCVFYQFRHLFDCVDGEVARVTNTKSIGGLYLEGIHDSIVESCFLACFGIGLYKMRESTVFVFFGFTFALLVCLVHVFNKSRKLVGKEFGKKERPYVFPLMKKQSVAGRIYRSVYRKVRLLFLFKHAHLILVAVIVFELVFPIKLSYVIYGVTLTCLSAYCFLYGFDWMARAIISSITNYRYLMRD